MRFEKTNDGTDNIAIFDLGDGDFGLYWIGPNVTSMGIEIWHDHAHDGSGCSNLVIDAFGRELDLEFCRSRDLTEAESAAIDSLLD